VSATTPGGFTIEESARRLGHFRWIEMRLFEVLGGWVQTTPDPQVKVWLAEVSRHHAWHAELLEERLPEVRELSPERQTVAPDAAVAAYVDALMALDGPDVTTDRLVGAYDVLVPRLVAAYTAHLLRCTPVADVAVARSVRFILADLSDDLAAARVLLDALTATDEAADRRGRRRAELELLLDASSGISAL
jgi:hypothetical protein